MRWRDLSLGLPNIFCEAWSGGQQTRSWVDSTMYEPCDLGPLEVSGLRLVKCEMGMPMTVPGAYFEGSNEIRHFLALEIPEYSGACGFTSLSVSPHPGCVAAASFLNSLTPLSLLSPLLLWFFPLVPLTSAWFFDLMDGLRCGDEHEGNHWKGDQKNSCPTGLLKGWIWVPVSETSKNNHLVTKFCGGRRLCQYSGMVSSRREDWHQQRVEIHISTGAKHRVPSHSNTSCMATQPSDSRCLLLLNVEHNSCLPCHGNIIQSKNNNIYKNTLKKNFFFFLQCRGCHPGPCAQQAGTLPLSYTTDPTNL